MLLEEVIQEKMETMNRINNLNINHREEAVITLAFKETRVVEISMEEAVADTNCSKWADHLDHQTVMMMTAKVREVLIIPNVRMVAGNRRVDNDHDQEHPIGATLYQQPYIPGTICQE